MNSLFEWRNIRMDHCPPGEGKLEIDGISL
jgi:hypothetical protein